MIFLDVGMLMVEFIIIKLLIRKIQKRVSLSKDIDPTKIKKVREVQKDKDPKTNVDMVKKIDEYYIYNEKGLYASWIRWNKSRN